MTRPGGQLPGGSGTGVVSTFGTVFPTVFDAIRSAEGITPYTDLSKVQVIRKRPESLGGGRVKANLNFLSLITEGDESQNIRLFDGDTFAKIGKNPIVLRDQLLKAGRSNLSPQFMEVFVSGRVYSLRGRSSAGSTLNQNISLAGGTKLLKGKVEFVRFNREGTSKDEYSRTNQERQQIHQTIRLGSW